MLSRRDLVRSAGLGAVAPLAACATLLRPTRPAPVSVDQLELVAEGLARPEGVVPTRDGRVITSSSEAAVTVIARDGSRRAIGRAPHPNGLAMDAQGRVVVANFGLLNDTPGILQRVDLNTGATETLCEAIEGRALVASNMPAIGPDGDAYCTHSRWANPYNIGDTTPEGFVYKVDANGRASIVCSGIRGANGICFSGDFEHLYVAQTAAGDVVRFSRATSGGYIGGERYGPQLGEAPDNISAQELRAMSAEQRSTMGHTDGLALDTGGNLWVTLPFANRVVAITPTGEVIVVIDDAEGRKLNSPTNLNFGGPSLSDLYIASLRNNSIWKVRTNVAGLPLAHWRA
jgi:gluconolactonase